MAQRDEGIVFLHCGLVRRISGDHGYPLDDFGQEGVSPREVMVEGGVADP
ncbi:hypothetical protein [Streptomyces sp. NBC_00620]|nr:hypothetical protein [Streptomyces sp. NBC_00620]MCX4978536.1 hypothetical protein [Streptomyces sp. NBC_00620]